MEDSTELCLEQKVERLHDSGLGVREIARRMGVEVGWVEALLAHLYPEESLEEGESG